jgi:hypothetical protein
MSVMKKTKGSKLIGTSNFTPSPLLENRNEPDADFFIMHDPTTTLCSKVIEPDSSDPMFEMIPKEQGFVEY